MKKPRRDRNAQQAAEINKQNEAVQQFLDVVARAIARAHLQCCRDEASKGGKTKVRRRACHQATDHRRSSKQS